MTGTNYHLKNAIESFIKTAHDQEYKGIEKYGKPLNPMDDYDWLEMAREELVDGFKYLEAERVKRRRIYNEIRVLAKDERIVHLVNLLEGSRGGEKI